MLAVWFLGGTIAIGGIAAMVALPIYGHTPLWSAAIMATGLGLQYLALRRMIWKKGK